jgi:hypothetical protein
MPHHIFRRASEQNMFQSCSSVGGGDDQLRAELLRAPADLVARVTAFHRTFQGKALPSGLVDQFAHLIIGRFLDATSSGGKS